MLADFNKVASGAFFGAGTYFSFANLSKLEVF